MAKKEEATGLKKFAAENKSLLFTIPVFVVLLVIVLFVYVFSGNDDDTAEVITPTPTAVATEQQTPTDTQPVETTTPDDDQETIVTPLPDTERDKDSDEIYRNPFAVPYKVSGIIYSSKGDSVAIIEAENKSFIVKVGDNAEDFFTVLDINKNSVTLEVEGQELILSLLDN